MERSMTDKDQGILLTTEEVIHLQESPITTAFYIILTLLAIFGMIGNTLVVVVMRKFEKMSISIYLSILAVLDNILLLVGKTFKLIMNKLCSLQLFYYISSRISKLM